MPNKKGFASPQATPGKSPSHSHASVSTPLGSLPIADFSCCMVLPCLPFIQGPVMVILYGFPNSRHSMARAEIKSYAMTSQSIYRAGHIMYIHANCQEIQPRPLENFFLSLLFLGFLCIIFQQSFWVISPHSYFPMLLHM